MRDFDWLDTPPTDPRVLEAELRRLNHVPLTAGTYNEMLRLMDDLGMRRASRVIAEELSEACPCRSAGA